MNNNINNISSKKKEVLKLLKTIGIDTRFISYTEDVIYINDQRFSKFSKKRQETFKKYFPEMEVISSTIFQKICIRASKVLSSHLVPKDKILILKPKTNKDNLLNIVLEPYSRKYGVTIIESIDENLDINQYIEETSINGLVKSTTLDEKVEKLLSNIFSGNGIGNINTEKENEKFKVIYPFINIPNKWIDVFISELKANCKNSFVNNSINIESESNTESNPKKNTESYIIANSFMEFLDNIIPQYKENLLKSDIFIENYLKNNEKN